MIEIALSNGGVSLVDDEDAEKVKHLTWFLSNKGYAIASTHENGEIVNFYMHRLIAGAGKGEQTDHIDGNRLNNTRANLRRCTATQNNMNLAKRKGCMSIFKGVSWSGQKAKWHARIKLHGKARHLGFYVDETEAAKAYNAAAVNLFGEFARLNPV